MCEWVTGFVMLFPLLLCMFENFRIKYVKKKEEEKKRNSSQNSEAGDIFFSPQRTAVTSYPTFPNLPFNQVPLEPCVDVFTTLKSIKLCKENSHSAESLLHENSNIPWSLHDPSCLSNSSHHEFWQHEVGTPWVVYMQVDNTWMNEPVSRVWGRVLDCGRDMVISRGPCPWEAHYLLALEMSKQLTWK